MCYYRVQEDDRIHYCFCLTNDVYFATNLQSGRMYYLNRKTLRKTWDWPKDQKLDLELNMSSRSIPMDDDHDYDYYSKKHNSSGSNNMIALPCSNCHLLVIVSQSSPCCPNCKYVHSLVLSNKNNATTSTPKCYDTLSLLN